MNKLEAIEELKKNINCGMAHAVLLRSKDGYRTELHAGHAGSCCCDAHADYVWREDGAYTDPDELDLI
jgi:hypothetical protein